MKEEIRLNNKIINNGNEISLNTIAYYQGEEYDLQDLLNGLLNQLQRKDNIINEMKKASDEIFHKYPYERKKWFDKINELEGDNK